MWITFWVFPIDKYIRIINIIKWFKKKVDNLFKNIVRRNKIGGAITFSNPDKQKGGKEKGGTLGTRPAVLRTAARAKTSHMIDDKLKNILAYSENYDDDGIDDEMEDDDDELKEIEELDDIDEDEDDEEM